METKRLKSYRELQILQQGRFLLDKHGRGRAIAEAVDFGLRMVHAKVRSSGARLRVGYDDSMNVMMWR